MENSSIPNTSGTPEEIQQLIIKDLNRSSSKGFLYDKQIGISISNNEELGQLGFSDIHLRDTTIEIVRQLLISGAVIVYGGDLRKEGYTELFSDLSRQYRSINEPRKIHFINYFAYPIYCQITQEQESDFNAKRVKPEYVPPPEDLNITSMNYIVPDSSENKYIWSKSLTYMRIRMIEKTNARIIMGGKVNNYLGKLPGVIEEALITIKQQKPLYLIGAMGGATNQVINALKGMPFSFKNDGYHTSNDYIDFKNYYSTKEGEGINLDKEAEFLSNTGVSAIASLNGLTIEENERLFQTPHLSEIIFLIFTGLSRINSNNHLNY